MTVHEFSTHYARLGEEFGSQTFGKGRGKLLFENIKELNGAWWKKIVDRMILEANPRFNIAEAARIERGAEYAARRTNEFCQRIDTGLTKISDSGALQAFKQFGAKSFAEAVRNNKKRQGYGS